MVQMLEHFGVPGFTERREPQLAFAVPVAKCRCGPDCQPFDPMSLSMCNPESCPVMQTACDGTNDQEELFELARRLRPDLEVNVRVFHLKQALDAIGPDLTRLEGYYCLSTITLPYCEEDINSVDGDERHYRENIGCQIDLGVSAVGASKPGDGSPDETARRALREYCCIDIAPPLWATEGQRRLRSRLEVDLPVEFWDDDTKVFVIILPSDAVSITRGQLLCYEPPAAPRPAESPVRKPALEATPVNPPRGSQAASGGSSAARSTQDWQRNQDEFKHLGKLPKPWIFVRSSRNKDIIYYLNTQTQATTSQRPLPVGWTKHKSKSTGKEYYYNASLHKSLFEFPPPE